MTSVELTLATLPPSANHLHKHFVKDGKVRRVKNETYAKWREAAIWEIAGQRQPKITGPYELHIEAERPQKTKRARDIDNLIKPISDALVKSGAVPDDSLAEYVGAKWADDVSGVVIRLCEVNSPARRGL